MCILKLECWLCNCLRTGFDKLTVLYMPVIDLPAVTLPCSVDQREELEDELGAVLEMLMILRQIAQDRQAQKV